MKSRTLPGYGNRRHRQHRERNRRVEIISWLVVSVVLVFVCLYQWVAQRDMTETTNRALLRQDSLEAVKLSQDKIIFLMQDTILQLRESNQLLKQQKSTLR
jgi:heme/copper-type cytochrome/quinol oxidase subunit 2